MPAPIEVDQAAPGGRLLRRALPVPRGRDPCFHVVPDRGLYHCFGCGARGGAIDFVMQPEDVEFSEAVRRLRGPVSRIQRALRRGDHR